MEQLKTSGDRLLRTPPAPPTDLSAPQQVDLCCLPAIALGASDQKLQFFLFFFIFKFSFKLLSGEKLTQWPHSLSTAALMLTNAQLCCTTNFSIRRGEAV